MWRLHSKEDCLVIEPPVKSRKCLVIQRNPLALQMLDKAEMDIDTSKFCTTALSFHAIIGVIEIQREFFLVLVSQILDAGSINGQQLFKIKDVYILSLRYDANFTKLPTSTKSQIDEISQIYREGMYFSNKYDLSTSVQNRVKSPLRPENGLFDFVNREFVWNTSTAKLFTKFKVSTKWITPIIQGYVQAIEKEIYGKIVQLALISRRKHKRAGTRFNARGLDDSGNAANLVETEQILVYDNQIYSHLQVRGSVPVFWEQITDLSLTRSTEMTFPAFCKHFDILVKNYGMILIFNLLSANREGEFSLTKAYEANVAAYEKSHRGVVKYNYFDIVQMGTEAIGIHLEQFTKVLDYFGYFKSGAAGHTQLGIIRSNCLDSLDRTNLFQSRVSFKLFQNQLLETGLVPARAPAMAKTHELMIELGKLWTENGKQLSLQYAGTEGNSGFDLVNRFLNNNFNDGFKQKCINLLLQKESILFFEMTIYNNL